MRKNIGTALALYPMPATVVGAVDVARGCVPRRWAIGAEPLHREIGCKTQMRRSG